jgi:AraC-like DNA-binding protein
MDLIAEEVAWLTAQPDTLTLQTPVPTNPRLVRLCREILRELDRGWTIDDAAEVAGMGRRTFTRAFKREVGISFNTWRSRARLNAAVCRLKAGASITSVALEAGYSNPSAFATMFKRCLGVPPSHFQIARTVRLAS